MKKSKLGTQLSCASIYEGTHARIGEKKLKLFERIAGYRRICY